MSNTKFFQFKKEIANNQNVNIKKFEIILKTTVSDGGKLTHSFTTTYPTGKKGIEFDDKKGIFTISIELNDNFYPISSIFWGKDYNTFKCETKDSDNLNFKITTDNNKLPFVIVDNVMKIVVPISLNATELGVSSLQNVKTCIGKEFYFGKIVILYTTEESEPLVVISSENKPKEYFTNNNKYVGIC